MMMMMMNEYAIAW